MLPDAHDQSGTLPACRRFRRSCERAAASLRVAPGRVIPATVSDHGTADLRTEDRRGRARWAGARRPAGTSTPDWTWLAVGGLLIASVPATALLVTDASGRCGMAAVAALVAGLPLVVVMAAGRRHPAQEG